MRQVTLVTHHTNVTFVRKHLRCHPFLKLKIHSGEKPFTCKLCYKSVGNKDNLKQHMDRMHVNRELKAESLQEEEGGSNVHFENIVTAKLERNQVYFGHQVEDNH